MSKKPRPQQKRPKPQEDQKETHALTATPSEFSFTLTKIAVSQICQSLGFKAAQISALEALTGVAAKYLQSVAESAAAFSTLSNRTYSNIFDLINALHGAHSGRGFEGASNAHKKCALSSGAVLELVKFVQSSDEIPFAKPVPRNFLTETSICPQNLGEFVPRKELNAHIPKWLPAFPDPSLCEKNDERMHRKRENLWENLVSEGKSSGFEGNNNCDDRRKKSGNLGAKRGKVRFKIEVDMRNGACRGGKRVCLGDGKNGGIDEEDGKISGFKRSR